MRYALGFAFAAALASGSTANIRAVELQANNLLASAPILYWSFQAQRAIVPPGPGEVFGAENYGNKSSTGPSVASQNERVPPDAPASAYGIEVPLAYYNLSFTLSKRTGGITPPVQGRIFAYMGMALYESVVSGMPRNRSIASSLHGIGPLPTNHGTKYWPLVASAALAEVMRGLWGDATNVAAQNVADIDSLEQQIADTLRPPGLACAPLDRLWPRRRRRGVPDIAR